MAKTESPSSLDPSLPSEVYKYVWAALIGGSILWWFVKGRKTRPVGQTVGASASAGSKVVAVEREVPDVYCKAGRQAALARLEAEYKAAQAEARKKDEEKRAAAEEEKRRKAQEAAAAAASQQPAPTSPAAAPAPVQAPQTTGGTRPVEPMAAAAAGAAARRHAAAAVAEAAAAEEFVAPTPEPPPPGAAAGEAPAARSSPAAPAAAAPAALRNPPAEVPQKAECTVTVKFVNGGSPVSLTLPVPLPSVLQLKELVHRDTGIPAEYQRLLYMGQILQDAQQLSAYRGFGEGVVVICQSLPGAPAPKAPIQLDGDEDLYS